MLILLSCILTCATMLCHTLDIKRSHGRSRPCPGCGPKRCAKVSIPINALAKLVQLVRTASALRALPTQ